MKILGIMLSLLMFSSVCAADQPTTVYSKVLSGKVTGHLPEVDGLNNEIIQNHANKTLADVAKAFTDKFGECKLSYTVELNRPSVIGVLLKAETANDFAYEAVNIDLTTGNEVAVNDFFTDSEELKALLGTYDDLLFEDDGLYMRTADSREFGAYRPYGELLDHIRISEAGRLVDITKLTEYVEGKLVPMEAGSLVAIKLPANRTTGFSWQLNVSDPVAVREIGRSYLMPIDPDSPTGASGEEIIMLAVHQAGEFKVDMVYKRPWEKSGIRTIPFVISAE